jgi:hypothetical protein
MFFARRLEQAGYHLGPIVVNRVHPRIPDGAAEAPAGSAREARERLRWLGERDHRGLVEIRSLVPGRRVVSIPLLPRDPTDLAALEALGEKLLAHASPTPERA